MGSWVRDVPDNLCSLQQSLLDHRHPSLLPSWSRFPSKCLKAWALPSPAQLRGLQFHHSGRLTKSQVVTKSLLSLQSPSVRPSQSFLPSLICQLSRCLLARVSPLLAQPREHPPPRSGTYEPLHKHLFFLEMSRASWFRQAKVFYNL